MPPRTRALPTGVALLAVLAAQALGAAPAPAASGTPLVDGGSYLLGSALDGNCLGPQYAQPAPGIPVTGAACGRLLSQRWQLRRTGDAYLLVNAATGRCLTLGGPEPRPATADCGASPEAERFTVSRAPQGTYTLTARGTGACLTADATPVRHHCDARPAHRWTLTRTEPLVLADPGFEQGSDGWTFTAHTGTATNNPHGGSRLAYLDAGPGYAVSQQVTAVTAGSYDLSAWIATGGAGGSLSVSVNGTVVRSLPLPEQTVYAKYSLPRVPVSPGDRLTLTVDSSPAGWINVDDAAVAPSAPNDPAISSSDPEVVALFDWAKTKANSWVQQAGTTGVLDQDENHPGGTGTTTYDATYWAGYPFRSAFYSRDFAHQLVGAHLLGLDAENKTMLRGFAGSATEVNKLYPVWALDFDARSYAAIDYRSPERFVRELPAPFELVQQAGEAFRWTGDRDYADDPGLGRYVRNTLGPFIAAHPGPVDNRGLPIPQATSRSIFAGTASYAENATRTYAEAGDAIGAQYQAYLSAATLADARGDAASATGYRKAAEDLRGYVNSTWSVDGSQPGEVVHGYDTTGKPVTGWGYEASVLMPVKQLLDPGPRRDAFLAAIDAADSGPERSANLEAYTYLPDAFFANHDGTTAWKWMRQIHRSTGEQHASGAMLNGDYPEVPFTLLSQTVQGLLGVTPDAAGHALATTPQLPASMGWLQVAGIPVGGGTVTVRHDGARRSTVTNTGAEPLTWEARIPGRHARVTVDGEPREARTTTVDGVTYTSTTVTLAPGRSATAAVTD
ncbi:RICIN domain-containing protein [Streptomyces sp. CBMA156]|uniref:RICIN domain-containing protein n=1 Tax=Streptomyces sp. CBMA156 TaxID=1930280 RepID=UPI001661B99B|nr:RICIN domain-containing protein [Streptomyces sp. CBMA156]